MRKKWGKEKRCPWKIADSGKNLTAGETYSIIISDKFWMIRRVAVIRYTGWRAIGMCNLVRRILGLCLAMAMLLGMMPVNVMAAGGDDSSSSIWNGASVVFVGDSITYGAGTEKTYHAYIDETGIFRSVRGMGVSGSCISARSDYGSGNSPLINR